MKFGISSNDETIAGQIDADEYGMGEYVQGVGRQILNQGIYEGQFKNEFKHGYGRHIWDDGEYYVGQFKNDKKQGPGIFTFKDGTIQEGVWADDVYLT